MPKEIIQIALARRYRPKTFQAVVGQEGTLRALSNALETKRLHHAYLFTDTRGVGKTSLARILAKCLNCEHGISANPCGKCSACLSIDEGRFVDLIEVDAASRTKVEDTRELLENVQYLPTSGRFKIYLIDEVHMLSTHSFNALLKTLEEPPAHVKFLLATTDPQKLPLTILSRCLQFHLHRLQPKQIASHLQFVLGEEAVSKFEMEALHIIAGSSEGSIRDALSLLDQAIAFGQGEILAEKVRAMLGYSPKGHLLALFRALIANNASKVMQEISYLYDCVSDFGMVLSELLSLIHQIAIAQKVPEYASESYEGIVEPEVILEFAKALKPEDLQLYYQIGLLGQRDLPFAPNSKMGFEMVLLRMLAFQPVAVVAAAVAAESVASSVVMKDQAKTSANKASMNEEAKVVINEPAIAASHEPTKDINANANTQKIETEWLNLIPRLNLNGLAKEFAQHCTVKIWSPNLIHLILDESKRPIYNKRYEERLSEAIKQHFNVDVRLQITIGTGVGITAAEHNKQLQEKAYQNARKTIESDPKVQNLMQMFDAVLEEVSVKEK